MSTQDVTLDGAALANDASRSSGTVDVPSRARLLGAVAVGAAIPLTGFTPLNHASGVLDLSGHPWRVIVIPSVVLTILVELIAWRAPRRISPLPRLVRIAGVALLLSASLSVVASNDVTDTLLVLIVALLTPSALLVALRRCDLPLEMVCIAFLVVTAALFLRDDWVFVRDYGLPTGRALFLAKFSNTAYDFHYYGLQNPDTFATFILIPLALSSFWAGARDLHTFARWLLITCSAISFITLVFAYIRVDLAIGTAVVICALMMSGLSPRARVAAVLVVVIAGAAFALEATTWHYLRELTNGGSSASFTVRAKSIVGGLETMTDHPLTGVGIDRYAPGGVPAHSSVAQAAAEIGIFGLLSFAALTMWLVAYGFRVGWRERREGLIPAASVAAGVYAACAAATGGARLGLAVNFVSVWALSLALVIAASTSRPSSDEPETPDWGVAEPRPRRSVPATMCANRGGVLPGLVGLGVVMAVLGVVTTRDFRRAQATQLPQVQESAGTSGLVQRLWSFGSHLPAGWAGVRGVSVRAAAGGVGIRTVGGPRSYQLLGPLVGLGPGVYEIGVTAQVVDGGLVASVLNVDEQKFLSSVPIFGSGPLVTTSTQFTLSHRTSAEMILSDFRVAAKHSRWLLENVSLRELEPLPRSVETRHTR